MKKTGGRKSRDTLPLRWSSTAKIMTLRWRLTYKYLSEFESVFKNGLVCYSRAQLGYIKAKMVKEKIRVWHRDLLHSEYIVLLCSFKERNILFLRT